MPKKKKASKKKQLPRSYTLILVVFLLAVAAFFFLMPFKTHTKPISRQWMEYSMEIVKKEKPHPPEAARFYAYVSSVYADVLLETNSTMQAGEATRQMINIIYPTAISQTNAMFEQIHGRDSAQLDAKAQRTLSYYKDREKTDGYYDLQWDEVIPRGPGKWIKTNKMPYSPRAGEWQRWIVNGKTDYLVPPPPVFGSDEDKRQLEIVTKAIAARDADWNKKIIYWQGIPGTESPAGIWQNILYDQSKSTVQDEHVYAKYQKILAMSIADSFMECWKIKYTYWTARPSMRIPDIVTSMPDPPFPSYLSGHSTISRTAAEVLGAFMPEKKSVLLHMAEEARDSRLYAGIHFAADNEEGFALGEKIGKEIITSLHF